MLLPLLLALQQAPLPTPADTPPPAHDALSYGITLRLPDTGTVVVGAVETRWRLKSSEPLRLELDSALQVTAVRVAGQPTREWTREGDLILIPVQGRRGDTLVSVVSYSGQVRDGLIITDNETRGRAFFADNWPNRAHRWFPAQDHPSDKATVSFSVVAPRGLEVIANGTLIGVDTLGEGRTRWEYGLDVPVPVYTMVLGAADFAVTPVGEADCTSTCVPVTVWTYVGDSAWAVNGPFRHAVDMVDYFSGLVGPFPYPSLAHVQSSTIFGGMENATAIFYDEKAYATQRLGEGTVAHETAHQWFGDAVTERDWSHLWLSEGFATYFSSLWSGYKYGDSAFQAGMQAAARTVRESPATERPIVDTADNLLRLLNSNNYQKGAWVLHSLRGLVGDSAFFRGIRDWYRTYRDSTALSEDFQAVMERTSGRRLDWYFRQALHQPGYPVLSTGVEPAGPGRLLITLRQVQDTSWGVFRLPGLRVRLDSTVVTLEVTDRESRRVIPWTGPPPASVQVDPGHWWLLDTTGGR